jgi:hypothetical protein
MNGRMFIMSGDVQGYWIFRHNTVIYAPNGSWTSLWGREFGQTAYGLNERYFNIQIFGETQAVDPHLANYQMYNNILAEATPL